MGNSGQTVFALSTAPGRAALAVVRITGPAADLALYHLGIRNLPSVRQAALRRLYRPNDSQILDEALVLRFQGPHSFTGENMVELHLHGGLACTQSVLEELGKMANMRPAEPGAFTRRAVLNGRLDLTAAEAIADLIDAEGSAQQQQALQQMGGALQRLMQAWREKLVTLLAHLEADLEFADEDLPGGIGRAALARVPELRAAMQTHLDDRRGIGLREGVRIAFLGPPNAGKSSIINRLSGREAAIVSARAGTTRDVIEVTMVMAGVPVTLVDTAGLRAAGDDIEREGVRRALLQADEADIRLWVSASDVPAAPGPQDVVAPEAVLRQIHDWKLFNKTDLGAAPAEADFAVSVTHGTGFDQFVQALEARVGEAYGARVAPVLTRQRHVDALQVAIDGLTRAEGVAESGLELAAEDLRFAMRALGRITGEVDVESLLDVVFADFCIGK